MRCFTTNDLGKKVPLYGYDTNGENEELAVVKWHMAEFYVHGAIENKNIGSIHPELDKLMVVGNIYENPELLKESNVK